MQPPLLFRPKDRQRQQQRAQLAEVAPILHEIYARTADRLLDMSQRFARIAHIGPDAGLLAQVLQEAGYPAAIDAVDMGPWLAREEVALAPESADAILCIMSLQHVNDVPGALIQMRRALKPNGLLLVALPGAMTLHELRSIFAEVESARSGGISPRIAPFPEVRDIGNVLGRAGLALPVVDSETITLTYPDMFALMRDMRHGGQGNCLAERVQHFTPRGFFVQAATAYAERFGSGQGRMEATLEMLTLTAWAPHESQQKPAARGSGKISLIDALKS